MQMQPAEALCLPLHIGRIDLVAMPAEYLPRRIDWPKWLDCINIGSRVMGDRVGVSPRICLSPDHVEAKDNMAVAYLQSQGTLEQIDPLALFSDVADGARFLFVGSWSQPLPTWFSSAQAIFGAHYAQVIPDFLSKQMVEWSRNADALEKNGSFLVTDELGRLSGLTSISRNWRNRSMRSGLLAEVRSLSWFAAVVDMPMARSAHAIDMRLHRLNVVEPESWCGAPKLPDDVLNVIAAPKDCPEIWISAPGLGVALWIAEQQQPIRDILPKLQVPGAILGWHPVRDLLTFLARAKDGSMLYVVDSQSRLQVLRKDGRLIS